MKRNRNLFGALSAMMVLVLMGAVWLMFAPVQFGGKAAYVIVTGISMEPHFHRGDLVILHQASDFQVGDIATYRHPDVGPIIHRIIAVEEDRFVFQGDNNTWIDSYRPTQAELIGKFWWHVPAAGKIMEKIRAPGPLALLAAVMGISLITTAVGSQVRPQGRRRARGATRKDQTMSQFRAHKTDLFFLLVTLALASSLLAVFAFTRPVSRPTTDPITYEQAGAFSYSAGAPPGVYNSDMVQAGEPIFRQLITLVTVNFDYRFVAEQPAHLAGTYRLTAEISHSNGWHRSLELQPETAFTGSAFSVSSVLDLAQVQALIDNLEHQTGLQRQQYTLTIMPEVSIGGTLAGETLEAEFSPPLNFRLDELQMQLAQDVTFEPSQTGLIARVRESPNTISLLGLALKVSTARQVAVVGLVLSLGGLLTLGWLMFQAGQGDEAAQIRSKYGSLLIDVSDSDLAASEQVVEVAAIDDLARLAERLGGMILHQARDLAHHYFVQDGGVIYHYQSSDRTDETPVQMEDGAP